MNSKVCDGCDILRENANKELYCDQTQKLIGDMIYCPEGNDTLSVEIYWEDLTPKCKERLKEALEWAGLEEDDLAIGPITILEFDMEGI